MVDPLSMNNGKLDTTCFTFKPVGARSPWCSLMVQWVVGSILHGGPIKSEQLKVRHHLLFIEAHRSEM